MGVRHIHFLCLKPRLPGMEFFVFESSVRGDGILAPRVGDKQQRGLHGGDKLAPWKKFEMDVVLL